MKYKSTRSHSDRVEFTQALTLGLAPDGGLYIPESFPLFSLENLSGDSSHAELAKILLAPFVDNFFSYKLSGICDRAFNFHIPLRELPAGLAVLELFHGPTSAFKDVGAQFLAECFSVLPQISSKRRTVIVATSGDTGGAVASAFHPHSDIEVFILYPQGRISKRQELQIACWEGRIHAIAVQGSFDDCQNLVKKTLSQAANFPDREFISANSISIGRLLPQMIYYAKASLEYFKSHHAKPRFIIPTGNLGNSVACLWAKKCGLPIESVVFATNANQALSDYLGSGHWQPQATKPTLANAMDVGNPSNFERLRELYPNITELRRDVSATAISDLQIQKTIQEGLGKYNEIWCPHTATAVAAAEFFGAKNSILVATAHPAKFGTIVEPLIGKPVLVPDNLQKILQRTPHSEEIGPHQQELFDILKK